MKALVYDIEIKRAVPDRDGQRDDGIDYCDGWDDKGRMGVACVGAFQVWDGRPRVFYADNRDAFLEAREEADILVSFNGLRFDEPVLVASGWVERPSLNPASHYDILSELWIAKGFDPDRFEKSHKGHGLDACARANGFGGKTGYGGTAPIDFQRGRHGTLVDYCLADVWLTAGLYDMILKVGSVVDPISGEGRVRMRCPSAQAARLEEGE